MDLLLQKQDVCLEDYYIYVENFIVKNKLNMLSLIIFDYLYDFYVTKNEKSINKL